MEAVSFQYRHLPTNTENDAELWLLGQAMDGSAARLFRNTYAAGWAEVLWPQSGADSPTGTGLIQMRMQSLHGKLFVAYKSAADRLHVWDGTTFRRAGLAEPAIATAANGTVFNPSYRAAVLLDAPVAYWRLNEASGVFVDSSSAGTMPGVLDTGAGHTMQRVLDTGATITYGVAGVLGDGKTGIAIAGAGGMPRVWSPLNAKYIEGVAWAWPALNLGGSFDFWVKPAAAMAGDGIYTVWEDILSGFKCEFQHAAGALHIRFSAGSGATTLTNTTALNPGTLYHLALVLQPAGTAIWYVNGVADGTSGAGAFAAYDVAAVYFLFNNGTDGSTPVSVTVIQEMAFYPSALAGALILQHYNAKLVTDVNSPSDFTALRHYRTRYTTQASGVTIRRSEPSDSIAFTPTGGFQSVTVTRPALINEGETHWELEASLDNITFYVIATTAVGTTTATDTTLATTGYAAFTLSEPIGTYALIPSCRLLTVDEDRLLVGGSFTTIGEDSWIRWTPVGTDPSPGQDERLNATTDPEIDLDGREGGALTDLSRAVNGTLTAFKASHIYRVLRTGQLVGAYTAICLTKARGALAGSVIEASDQGGRPALYFIDPLVGAMRIGAEGLQACGMDIRPLWRRMNIDGSRPCHGVYYSSKLQAHWWIALDGSDTPNWKVVLQTNELRSIPELGARRGWSVVPAPARIASALCSVMFDPAIDGSSARSRQLVPFIGKQQWTV